MKIIEKYKNTVEFFGQDFPRTLFPLNTNKILIENFSDKIGAFVYKRITDKKDSEDTFLPQIKAFADKSNLHLRRTLKLDPVAEFFLYDIVYRHRSKFRKDFKDSRKSFGYQFSEGKVISPSKSYSSFNKSVHEALGIYKYCAKFDISTYFNSIYHHDLIRWFNDIAETNEDAEMFDKFFKQINVGRSVDCLPHGIMPSKILGSHFLKFIDNSNQINCELLLRYMDDFYLFSDNHEVLTHNFFFIQRLLGDKALSLNSSKTEIGEIKQINIIKDIDEIKQNLLERRRWIISASGVGDEDFEDDFDDFSNETLNEEEIEYLMNLLKSESLEESDAELILTLMRDHNEDIVEYIPIFLEQFPNLIKSIFFFCDFVDDINGLSEIILNFLRSSSYITEFQLFWIAKLSEEFLCESVSYGNILSTLFSHTNATPITKAKVLEIPEKRFGMSELREGILSTGSSDWLAWSSAIGSRVEQKKNRNHLLKYFSNGSSMNKLIADCVVNYEEPIDAEQNVPF
jgi:hypothetical protein